MKASNKDVWSPSASVMKNHDININSLTFSKLMQYLLTQKEGCLKDFNHYIQTTKEKYCQFLDEFHATFKTRQIYAGGLMGSVHGDMEYDYDDGDDDLIDAPLEMASSSLIDGSEKFYNEIHLFDDSAVQLKFMNNSLNISGYFTNSDLFKQMSRMADKYEVIPEPVKEPGYVYAVVKDVLGNLQLHNIGLAGITLQEANYPESVVKQYNLALEDFRNSSPAGRVVILEGVPGSGKTHLVRSFLTDADDATFVLIPPDMITELSGPTFLPLLISSCSNTDNPVVLVLEDADRCLVARDDKNMNAIQALLNLSDGILGSMLDIRILATTNATKLDLEPAILRPGRLSQRIEINQLSAKETKKCWESLLPNVSLPSSMKGKHTLAEIYLEARNHGWKATE